MTSFAELGLDGRIVEVLRRMDVVEATPIQEAAIPEMMAGRDIVGQARTGSGKTLAFGLPLLSLCDASIAAPQALILVPTRELAGQVARVIDKIGPTRNLRAAQLYGGRDMSDQIMLLNTGPQIIIATPGRLLDHLYRGTLSFRELRVLVLDEADQMLDQGFAEDVDRIFDCAPGKLQTALFSATVPNWVHEVISHRLHDPAFVKVDEEQRGPNECVEHTVIEVPPTKKLDALRRLLRERGNGTVIVFARTKIGVERLEQNVQSMGFNVAALQGNLSQGQRERVLRGFRRGNPPILVATNVAARGLDILSIEQVINFDVPESAELLTHRLGRTGRMGRHGSAVTLLTPADGNKWKAIERQIGIRVERERWGQEIGPSGAENGASQSAHPRNSPQPAHVAGAHTENGDLPVAAASNGSTAAEARNGSTPGDTRAETQNAGAVQQNADAGRSRGNRRPSRRERHEATCATCQQQTTVSFLPRPDRPVYCNACYRERRDSTAA